MSSEIIQKSRKKVRLIAKNVGWNQLPTSDSEDGTMIHLGNIKSCGSKIFEKDMMILDLRLIHLIVEFHWFMKKSLELNHLSSVQAVDCVSTLRKYFTCAHY